jgi:hypothetical protein
MDPKNRQFIKDGNLIMACHITGVYDVNRNTILEDNNYELVRNWAESVANAQLQGIIFHNNFSQETCEKYHNEYITFIKINHNPEFNPNVFRYFVYRDFLEQHIPSIYNVFVTDISDVTLAKNPFISTYFLDNKNTIFCGDEPKKLNNSWMIAHSENLRNNMPDFADYELEFGNETLLNCGIIGGEAPLLLGFFKDLCSIHQLANSNNQTAYTGDMGAFNYLARTKYNHQLKHGEPINTVFKQYENQRNDCWFRHK